MSKPGKMAQNSVNQLYGRDKKKNTSGTLGKSFSTIHTQDDGPPGGTASQTGTSIFDPVLCELAYNWFCPPGGVVLDPFAGGSVRGIVAAYLGRKYIGVELREEQVAANRVQAVEIIRHESQGDKVSDPDALTPVQEIGGALPITSENAPVWHCGDSMEISQICKGVQADFVFSCPPYADLEVYSDDPRDISTMKYGDFLLKYLEIIRQSCELLKDNRFACFVVGEARDSKGNYYGFVPDTIAAFREAGLQYYNEAILVTNAGSLPIRAGKAFQASRKLGKTHQNVLVFVKGDGKKAAKECGDVYLPELA